MRLDMYLVENGHFPSRARAQAAVKAGLVCVNGVVAAKPSAPIAEHARVEVAGDAHDYVSRGGVKLDAALRAFEIDPAGKVCLDLGASTGGFTDVLLRGGAKKVYAVDVGTGQLHAALIEDARVVNLEKTHAKSLTRALVPEPIDLLVCDVSFIGLKKALPPAMALCAPGAILTALIKPQFELGPAHIGKGGIVKASPEAIAALTDDIKDFCSANGWKVLGLIDSPIEGGDGNREFLIGAIKSA
ncbi:MAG: TlyA family rRNA (cytidine-2'-O)-methyltransferase [Alphaproteobacteria bacterium]|nr:TlyA family rRNA (cytidine-2'-O)-methyltransferase [Alphaproteobacteria bacterium]